MASSDEEGEYLPDCVSNFEFWNQTNEHVSFACLPILWCKDEPVDSGDMRVYLSGEYDDGLQRLYKEVMGWRFELSYVQPEISVFCKGKHWVKLLKPKRLYESAFRALLVTIHCLHFVKHNPEATVESIWNHLSRVFSAYEVPPSEADCMNHLSMIRDAAKLDKTLASSKYILSILAEQPVQRIELQMEALAGRRPDFIVDEFTDDPCEDVELCDQEEELFDTCCSLCDNGGDILCCEGRCMRSFHATDESGEDFCDSLGLSEAQVNAMNSFICLNCQHQQHQCFICGELGSSDISFKAEVFPCIAANCGRFYHPKCVSKALQQQSDSELQNLEQKIAAGESFVCPAHRCYLCKQVENRIVREMQFAVCRRCPKSYHRKCLPREITFENDDDDDYETEILPRAWEDLLPKRILIYCLDHEIDLELRTPLRDHIRFPETTKEKRYSAEPISTNLNVLKTKKESLFYSSTDAFFRKTERRYKKGPISFKGSVSSRVVGNGISKPGSFDQKKTYFSNLKSSSTAKVDHLPNTHSSSTVIGGNTVPGKSNFNSVRKLSSSKLGNANSSGKKFDTVHSVKPLIKKQGHSSSAVDVGTERRITALMEEVKSKFDMAELMKNKKVLSIYNRSSGFLDKTLTKGKVEVTVKAIREALHLLKNGRSIDDAKAVCSPEMLRQVPLWKNKLKLYLGPFLHGQHYSSYGRHFTKLEKLQEIVTRLQWYVQDGDTIVDFCCGANDFSRLMKEKLDSMGKTKCSFKNYDLFPTKNDFNFECKDWFTVEPKDLPQGSQLIMGLNPPFGFNASLANKFITKALQFKPKLLILIVPPMTQRLDSRKHGRYDLIWEDPNLLTGQAFYLPGAFDVHDNQISQWNLVTPPLYLWSHPAWTKKHRDIAIQFGHLKPPVNPSYSHPFAWNNLPEQNRDIAIQFGQLKPPVHPSPSHLFAWNNLPQQQDHHGDIMNVFGNLPNVVDDLEDMEISPTNSPCYRIP